MPYDPLDGIEDRPTRTQVAMVVVELRNIRLALGGIQKTQTWVLRSFVGLLVTLVTGLALFAFTGGHP